MVVLKEGTVHAEFFSPLLPPGFGEKTALVPVECHPGLDQIGYVCCEYLHAVLPFRPGAFSPDHCLKRFLFLINTPARPDFRPSGP
jgi:hypothetical protein